MTSLGNLSASESTVLVPRDPSITNSDDWPEFRLNAAFATLPGSRDQEPTSLLLASEHCPITVYGRLAPPTAAQEHLWRRKDGGKKGTSIVIEDVRSFAYGAYDDGSVEIWAAGKAGWFVLQPGRAYRSTYQGMCEAVKMLFFVVDAYTESAPKKKGKGASQNSSELSANLLIAKYAQEELRDSSLFDDAAEAVYTHRDFLLASMLAGKEGIAWSKNPLFRHLAKKFPDDLQAIRDRLAPPRTTEPSKTGAHARQGSVESDSTNSSLKRKRGRPRKNPSVDVISIGSSSTASSRPKDVPQRQAAAYRSDTQKSKQSYQAAPSTRRTRNNSQSIPPASADPEIEESATPTQNTSTAEDDNDDDDEDEIPARAAAKRKSALRLKPNKPMKGPPKRSKAPTQDDDELTRSSPIPSKRRRASPTDPTRPSKPRTNPPSEDDEGIDIPSSPSSQHRPSPPPLADALAAHTPDAVQEATWRCALAGCTHKVFGDPGDPASQRLIREHYALHAYDDDARVRLVKRLQAPSLPVGHLMERVKVAAKGEGFPGSVSMAGSRFPGPLRTRY